MITTFEDGSRAANAKLFGVNPRTDPSIVDELP